MELQCPTLPTKRNAVEIGDLLNGSEGSEYAKFAHEYLRLRQSLVYGSREAVHVYQHIKDYVAGNPYTYRRREKKKTPIQLVFEESHYPHNRPSFTSDHPAVVRDTKQLWNMNPGRLFIPKHVGDRMREIRITQRPA
jgi:hypothetical protein